MSESSGHTPKVPGSARMGKSTAICCDPKVHDVHAIDFQEATGIYLPEMQLEGLAGRAPWIVASPSRAVKPYSGQELCDAHVAGASGAANVSVLEPPQGTATAGIMPESVCSSGSATTHLKSKKATGNGGALACCRRSATATGATGTSIDKDQLDLHVGQFDASSKLRVKGESSHTKMYSKMVSDYLAPPIAPMDIEGHNAASPPKAGTSITYAKEADLKALRNGYDDVMVPSVMRLPSEVIVTQAESATNVPRSPLLACCQGGANYQEPLAKGGIYYAEFQTSSITQRMYDESIHTPREGMSTGQQPPADDPTLRGGIIYSEDHPVRTGSATLSATGPASFQRGKKQSGICSDVVACWGGRGTATGGVIKSESGIATGMVDVSGGSATANADATATHGTSGDMAISGGGSKADNGDVIATHVRASGGMMACCRGSGAAETGLSTGGDLQISGSRKHLTSDGSTVGETAEDAPVAPYIREETGSATSNQSQSQSSKDVASKSSRTSVKSPVKVAGRNWGFVKLCCDPAHGAPPPEQRGLLAETDEGYKFAKNAGGRQRRGSGPVELNDTGRVEGGTGGWSTTGADLGKTSGMASSKALYATTMDHKNAGSKEIGASLCCNDPGEVDENEGHYRLSLPSVAADHGEDLMVTESYVPYKPLEAACRIFDDAQSRLPGSMPRDAQRRAGGAAALSLVKVPNVKGGGSFRWTDKVKFIANIPGRQMYLEVIEPSARAAETDTPWESPSYELVHPDRESIWLKFVNGNDGLLRGQLSAPDSKGYRNYDYDCSLIIITDKDYGKPQLYSDSYVALPGPQTILLKEQESFILDAPRIVRDRSWEVKCALIQVTASWRAGDVGGDLRADMDTMYHSEAYNNSGTPIADVTVVCERKVFPATRAVLMARSRVFAQMLNGKLKAVVVVTGAPPLVVQNLVDYIHTDRCELLSRGDDLPNVVKLFETAVRFQVAALVNELAIRLIMHLDEEIVGQIDVVAKKTRHAFLLAAVRRFREVHL